MSDRLPKDQVPGSPSTERDAAGCDEFVELCAGQAMGALSEADEARLVSHVEQGCEACSAEWAAAQESLVLLAEAALAEAPDEKPGSAVRDRVMAEIRGRKAGQKSAPAPKLDEEEAQPWRVWNDTAQSQAMFFLHATEGAWEPTGVAGIDVRRLFVDHENDRMTAMFRMAAGTSYTPHIHSGHEECYVLQGDLRVGDVVMRAGDYQRAAAGSRHAEQSTEGGCLLLISSSMSDELD